MKPVAALFVQPDGCYANQPGVDVWDEARDARLYRGDMPVVCHPCCKRWGRYAEGSPRKPKQYTIGQDGGGFASALANTRRVGGVIEHPAHTKAWKHFGLKAPPKEGGWVSADDLGGLTCHVEQGHYGHFARKKTWLYAFGVITPELIWGEAEQRLPEYAVKKYGYAKARRIGVMAAVGGKDKTKIREATPPQFRDLLIGIARTSIFA